MSVESICKEWMRGCSCAPRNAPYECIDCTRAFFHALDNEITLKSSCAGKHEQHHTVPAKVTVDAAALREILSALTGPSMHLRELLAVRGLPALSSLNGVSDPIGLVIKQFNDHFKK